MVVCIGRQCTEYHARVVREIVATVLKTDGPLSAFGYSSVYNIIII